MKSIVVGVFIGSVIAVSCASEDNYCERGTEGCPCLAGGECYAGLACASNTCVDLGSDDDAGDDAGDDDGSTPSGRVEGGPCQEEGSVGCGTSAAGEDDVALSCQAGAWRFVFACPGLQACTDVGGYDRVDCGGTNYAVDSAPCAQEGGQACSIDGQVVLVCEAGTWFEAIHCPPSNCARVPESPDGRCSGHWCSNCGYTLGDWCDFAAGSVNCSTDLSLIVQCANGAVTLAQDCAAQGLTCTLVDVNTLGCQ